MSEDNDVKSEEILEEEDYNNEEEGNLEEEEKKNEENIEEMKEENPNFKEQIEASFNELIQQCDNISKDIHSLVTTINSENEHFDKEIAEIQSYPDFELK